MRGCVRSLVAMDGMERSICALAADIGWVPEVYVHIIARGGLIVFTYWFKCSLLRNYWVSHDHCFRSCNNKCFHPNTNMTQILTFFLDLCSGVE
jgi:hypothetical protein